ncbi:MAG: MarR family transcriptional regulator [Pseudomonadota bacterium]
MFEKCLYFNTIKFSRQINSIWDDAFRPLGLSPSHAYCIQIILQQPGITPKNLAVKMELNLSTVSRFIDGLSSKGLVERRKENQDKRECSLYPTKRGKDLSRKLDVVSKKLHKKIRNILGVKEVNEAIILIKDFSYKINNHTD